MYLKDEQQQRTISISLALAQRIEKRIKGTPFKDISAFVSYVVSEVLETDNSENTFNAEDERRIKEHLRSLGYLD